MTKRTSSVRRLATVGVGAVLLVANAATSATSAPAASAQAKLAVASNVVIPHSHGSTQLVMAEASNGVVAVAVPRSSTIDDLELQAGAHQPRLFATVPSGTVAMAFSQTALFVAGKHAMSSFDRKTGAVIRTWQIRVAASLGAAGAPLVFGDGRLWAIGTAGHSRQVYEVKPSSSKLTSVGSGRNVFSIAAGPHGVYFVVSGGHTLTRVTAAGNGTLAPTHEKVNEQLSGPAALQAIAVSGSTLLVVHDFGQGLDAALVRYGAGSLKHLSSAGTEASVADVVPTVDGDLALVASVAPHGCAGNSVRACVARVVPKTAAISGKLRLPGASLSAIVGPAPAVLIAEHGHAHLVRLS
jgi:hypothetical protein